MPVSLAQAAAAAFYEPSVCDWTREPKRRLDSVYRLPASAPYAFVGHDEVLRSVLGVAHSAHLAGGKWRLHVQKRSCLRLFARVGGAGYILETQTLRASWRDHRRSLITTRSQVQVLYRPMT